jgi:hypothetical protein
MWSLWAASTTRCGQVYLRATSRWYQRARHHQPMHTQRLRQRPGQPRQDHTIGPRPPRPIRRFGQYCHARADAEPEAYEPHLDVDFTQLGEADTEQAA